MYLIKLLGFSSLLTTFGHCRDLWSENLPQGPQVLLEEGKPIQLSENYTKIQLCHLKGTLYSDSLSQLDGITELKICQHQLVKIEKGALCAASSVKVLEVDFYDNSHTLSLTRETFENCEHLEELLLHFDFFNPSAQVTLEENVFTDLTNLKKLAIQGYSLRHLTKKNLKVPSNLKELFLASNSIKEIEENVFEDLKNLETLYIVHNEKLVHLPNNLFRTLNKLKRLNLRDNAIKNLTWDEFQGLSSLEELTITDNLISSFDADKIAKNMPNLRKIEFELNPGGCKEKDEFVKQLKQKINHPIEVSYEMNFGVSEDC